MLSFALNKCLKRMFKEVTNLDVKERILLVARDLFIQNGYNSTSIRDIASASGTNVAMVNYYYHSKYNLFEIIFDEALGVLMKRVFSIVSSDKSFFELVGLWIDSYYETLIEYPQIPIFILNEINQNPERLTERVRQHEPFQIFVKLSERVDKEVRMGNIRSIPPLDLILNVLSLCIFPFVFGRMAIRVADKTQDEYDKMLNEHKTYVKDFVIAHLSP